MSTNFKTWVICYILGNYFNIINQYWSSTTHHSIITCQNCVGESNPSHKDLAHLQHTMDIHTKQTTWEETKQSCTSKMNKKMIELWYLQLLLSHENQLLYFWTLLDWINCTPCLVVHMPHHVNSLPRHLSNCKLPRDNLKYKSNICSLQFVIGVLHNLLPLLWPLNGKCALSYTMLMYWIKAPNNQAWASKCRKGGIVKVPPQHSSSKLLQASYWILIMEHKFDLTWKAYWAIHIILSVTCHNYVIIGATFPQLH